MRLVKLFAYSLLGYVLYELYLGMTEGAAQMASGSNDSPSAPPQRTAGKGATVAVEDANGAATRRKVGRGVVH
jgi:hypothetical protein